MPRKPNHEHEYRTSDVQLIPTCWCGDEDPNAEVEPVKSGIVEVIVDDEPATQGAAPVDRRTAEADRPVAQAEGEDGIDRALEAAHEEWVEKALHEWHLLASERNWATAAHLSERLPAPPKGSLSALGHIIKSGAENGWWTKSGSTWVPPGKTYHNSKPLPVWLSLLFEGEGEAVPGHCATCTCTVA